SAYVNAFLVLNAFNLFDALVIDYLVLTLMQPRALHVPGIEGMEYALRDPRMHITNYVKGIVFCAVFALPIAAVVALL
ncbi:MAG: hypothetical protein JNJ61_01010, partial [Anaerolineae bacterium]|nr:hypothetical protein [Anaerolineae bacterium]